jgi:hypothetical protein
MSWQAGSLRYTGQKNARGGTASRDDLSQNEMTPA